MALAFRQLLWVANYTGSHHRAARQARKARGAGRGVRRTQASATIADDWNVIFGRARHDENVISQSSHKRLTNPIHKPLHIGNIIN